MKIVFLDIDGVLNSYRTKTKTPGGFVGISDSLSKKLKKIIVTASTPDEEVQVVLTSSWKYMDPADEDHKYMLKKLSRANASPIGMTNEPEDDSQKRGQGVWAYLNDHNEITQYVILDDYMFDMSDDLARHLVLTDEQVGLTDSNVDTAIAILNGELLSDNYYEGHKKERGYYR